MSSHQNEETQSNQIAGFIAKTFQILNNQQFSKISFWAPSGSEFIIKDINKFQTIVLPRYFRHNKMNSFIRQLNMYGFHKSRADHSKSVFSHPHFLKGRQDLLMYIRRKIKGKPEPRDDEVLDTPVKKRAEVELQTTASKKVAETGHDLRSEQMMMEVSNNVSFNLLGTKEKLNSLINLNFTINRLPLAELGELRYNQHYDDDSCHSASIAGNIEQEQDEEDRKDHREAGSFKFMNPSCFFDSMKKSN